MTRDERIWLAGLFDAGGSARAYRTTAGKRGGHRWVFQLSFAGAQPEVMTQIHTIVGAGSLCRQTSRSTPFAVATTRTRPAHSVRYIATARLGRRLAKELRPYVRVRGDRIDQALRADARRSPDAGE